MNLVQNRVLDEGNPFVIPLDLYLGREIVRTIMVQNQAIPYMGPQYRIKADTGVAQGMQCTCPRKRAFMQV